MSKKILLLDDETEYIASLQKFLQEFNYAVGSTISSKQALELIRDDKPDLVLFDYKSLDMDGDVFFKKAKEICPSIPYILVTAWNDPAILERFKKMGVTDIILKPIDLKNLLSKLQKILGEG
ncbi:MAG: response regulator [Candidatus Omnitrophica bacterium]|nr:response regulator [Candidatus Omnitrophota bacterium]